MKLALLAAISLVQPAHDAHLYEPSCCGSGDCFPVEDVVQTPGGYVVEGTFVSKNAARPSKDSRFHWCVRQGHVICLYVPMGV